MKEAPAPEWLDVGEWIVGQILGPFDLESVFGGAMERLQKIGAPFSRVGLSMSSIHPMFGGVDVVWERASGAKLTHRARRHGESPAWLDGPLRALLKSPDQPPFFDFDLRVPGDWQRFEALEELRKAGATAYFAAITPFEDPELARQNQDGMILSWVSDQPEGFGQEDRRGMLFLNSRIALAAKLAKREETTTNLVSTYLGSDVGRRVLQGQITRGDMEVTSAIIWYSDLRDSTPLAEAMEGAEFLATLNQYFECTAGAVLEHGGEVLRFIGDAVLGIFPVTGVEGQRRWARVALAAAQSASTRLVELNEKRQARSEVPIRFGLALHVGDVYFGNIGVPERLEFTVIGPAANEVARLEGLTKKLGTEVVVSAEFAKILPLQWRGLGRHPLRGVGQLVEVFTPPGLS